MEKTLDRSLTRRSDDLERALIDLIVQLSQWARATGNAKEAIAAHDAMSNAIRALIPAAITFRDFSADDELDIAIRNAASAAEIYHT